MPFDERGMLYTGVEYKMPFTPELLNKGIPTGPPKENELEWISCPKKEENGCEYHVRVFKKTVEANLKMHREHCPLITTGDDVPEHFTNSTPAPAGAGKADMPSEKPCSFCGDKATCSARTCPRDGYASSQETSSREDSPEDRSPPSHSWEPLRRALSDYGIVESDEEKYAKWVEKRNNPLYHITYDEGGVRDEFSPPERHPNSERFHDLLREAGELHDLKQSDYGRGDDPFANVRSSEDWGISPWIGAMVRLNDKVRRLQSLATKGELKNEAAIDSFMDIAVYALIARILYEQGNE